MQSRYRQINSQSKGYYINRGQNEINHHKAMSTEIKSISDSEDFVIFIKSLKKVIKKYIPDFKLSSKGSTYEKINLSIEEAFEGFMSEKFEKSEERYKEATQFIQSTTKNLKKYETLIEKKAKELEKQMKNWDETKDLEEKFIEKEKNEIKELKNKLEKEILIEKEGILEKINMNSRLVQEIKDLETIVLKEKLENQSFNWSIDQKLQQIEEKQSILDLKQKMLDQEKEEIRSIKVSFEDERIKNKIIIEDLIKRKNTCKKCEMSSKNSDFSPETIKRPLTAQHFESPDTNMLKLIPFEGEETVSDLYLIKSGLESSKKELEKIKDEILPELQIYYEELLILINDLKDLKNKTEKNLHNFNEKFSIFNEKSEEVLELAVILKEQMKELKEKEEEVNFTKEELEANKEKVRNIHEELEKEVEDFQREKIEFLNEISEERKNIENYYLLLEEKYNKLGISEQLIQASKIN